MISSTDGAFHTTVPERPEIFLVFTGNVADRIRSRISYAFRVFCAVYGYKVAAPGAHSSALQCVYGDSRRVSFGSADLFIPARYAPRRGDSSAGAFTQHRYAGEDFHLAFGPDPRTGRPDWLGEIFEWLSSSHELGIKKRDAIGRIPYSETVFATQGLNPRIAHVNRLMAWMENELRGSEKEMLPRPTCPLAGGEHVVLASHDIDFYYTDRAAAFVRVLKNLILAGTLYRSPSFFADNAQFLFRLVRGARVGDYLPPLLARIEELGFTSTFFVVARRRHRRDPAYGLSQIAMRLGEAVERGFSVGLHGSYCSMDERRFLAEEAELLSNALQRRVRGGRQHWLRFHSHEQLLAGIEDAGLAFDSSLGFAERVGFRNGAAFAFPPYDFRKEAPAEFLEFPLMLMDGSLEATCRESGEDPGDVAREILDESRRWGWGGAALLWHDPIESLQVPREINRVFWSCAQRRDSLREKWMGADEFLASFLTRYHDAGLLRNVAPPPRNKSNVGTSADLAQSLLA